MTECFKFKFFLQIEPILKGWSDDKKYWQLKKTEIKYYYGHLISINMIQKN